MRKSLLSWLFFLPDRLVRISFIASIGLNLASWVLAIQAILPFYGKADLMVLHRTVYFGIDLVGPWYRALFLPLFGLGAIVVNFFLSQHIWKKEVALSHLISLATIFLQALIILAVFGILRLNM